MLYIFFCGFKVLLPNEYYMFLLPEGRFEGTSLKLISILRDREFCYFGAHSPKNLKIYLSCFSEVIRLC